MSAKKSKHGGSMMSYGASNLGKITSFGQKMSKKKTDRLTHEGMSDQQYDKMWHECRSRVILHAHLTFTYLP